jgi:hypothetical protein
VKIEYSALKRYDEYMELAAFLEKNQIALSPAARESCEIALKRMAESRDVLHDQNHILRMYDLLDQFLANEKGVSKILINFDVLLVAISWHDVWKATRRGKSFFDFLYSLYWDGFGSARIFIKHNHNLEPKVFNQTYYAVRRHGPPRWFLKKTLELKILRDLDGLEEWSLMRLEGLVRQYENNRTAIHRLGRWLKIYFDMVLKKQKDNKYYFAWSKEEFLRKKEAYVKRVNELILRYDGII